MIFPTFAVVVGALLVVCDAGVPETLAGMRAAHNKDEIPALSKFLAKRSGAAAMTVTPQTTYTTTGWVSFNEYAELTSCSTPVDVYGFMANTCYKFDDTPSWAKFMLTGDTCTGAVLQTFSDDACTTSTGSEDLVALGPTCATDGNSMTCTSSTTPSIAFQSAIQLYSTDTTCGSIGSMAGYPANTCYGDVKFTCSGSQANVVQYTDNNCGGTATTVAVSETLCMSYTDAGQDDSYAPGDNAQSYTMMCAGNGASGLFNSMSVKAVAALVVGVVAFLAV